jgi:hypothetical protein
LYIEIRGAYNVKCPAKRGAILTSTLTFFPNRRRFPRQQKFQHAKPVCYTLLTMASYTSERAVQHQHRRRRKPPTFPGWQRIALFFYVLFLALVMPFICWGAWAEPGHPHGSPHFVFATPVFAEASGSGPSLNQIVWSLQSYCGNPRTDAPAATSGAETDPVTPAGQSLPDTTLLVSMLLILLASWLQLENPRQSAERVRQFCVATPFAPLVPTPPPRFA